MENKKSRGNWLTRFIWKMAFKTAFLYCIYVSKIILYECEWRLEVVVEDRMSFSSYLLEADSMLEAHATTENI